MKFVLLALLVTGCSSQSRVLSSQRHDRILVGYSCPVNYYYRVDTNLCHRVVIAPSHISARPVAIKKVARKVKPKLDCVRVLREINQCSH